MVVAALLIGAAAIYGMTHAWTLRSEVRIAALTAAANCQTDLLAPFIQSHKLAGINPADGQSFRDFLATQVRAGLITETEATQVLASITASEQGEPLYTSRGWVMPIIAQGFQQ